MTNRTSYPTRISHPFPPFSLLALAHLGRGSCARVVTCRRLYAAHKPNLFRGSRSISSNLLQSHNLPQILRDLHNSPNPRVRLRQSDELWLGRAHTVVCWCPLVISERVVSIGLLECTPDRLSPCSCLVRFLSSRTWFDRLLSSRASLVVSRGL